MMNPENTQALLTAFPRMYRSYYEPESEASCMSRGFTCPDRWFPLLWRLSQAIQDHLDRNPHLADFEVVQVKEKFGTLRYYYRGGDEFIRELVEQAELETVREREAQGATFKFLFRVPAHPIALRPFEAFRASLYHGFYDRLRQRTDAQGSLSVVARGGGAHHRGAYAAR